MPPASAIARERLLDLWADRAVAISRRYGPMPAGLFVWHLWPSRVNTRRAVIAALVTRRRRAGRVAKATAYQRRHREAGLCCYCSKRAVPGLVTCSVHRQNQATRDRAYRDRLRGGPPTQVHRCGTCRALGHDHRTCPQGPCDPKTKRRRRLADAHAYRERQRAAGLCRDCSLPTAPGRRFCAGHLAANRARDAAYRARRCAAP